MPPGSAIPHEWDGGNPWSVLTDTPCRSGEFARRTGLGAWFALPQTPLRALSRGDVTFEVGEDMPIPARGEDVELLVVTGEKLDTGKSMGDPIDLVDAEQGWSGATVSNVTAGLCEITVGTGRSTVTELLAVIPRRSPGP